MPLKAQGGILAPHAQTIVLHGDPVSPCILQLHGDTRSAGIEGILHELLDDGSRALHHLSGGDLVRHVLGQTLDAGFRGRAHGDIRYSRAKSVVSTQSNPRQAA